MEVIVCEESFEKLQLTGSGFFSKSFLVRKKGNGKFYTMKVYDGNHQERSEENIEIANFVRNILVKRHPYVVPIHYCFRTMIRESEEGNDSSSISYIKNSVIVTSVLNGGNLFSRMRKERMFKESEVVLLSAEILLTMEHLHNQGIINITDTFKPENILIDDEGHLSFSHFEDCVHVDHWEEFPRQFGSEPTCTAEYFAPEILLYDESNDSCPKVSFISDFWSFGIFLYEMLTGITPFFHEDTMRMYQGIIYDKVIFNHIKISTSAKDLITKLLSKDPKKRLGYPNNPEEIRNHPFFSSIDWDDVYNRKTEPKYIPKVNGPSDTSYINREFLESSFDDIRKMMETPPPPERIFQEFTFSEDEDDDNNNDDVFLRHFDDQSVQSIKKRKKKRKRKKKKSPVMKKKVQVFRDEFYYCLDEDIEFKSQQKIDLRERISFLDEEDVISSCNTYLIRLGDHQQIEVLRILIQ